MKIGFGFKKILEASDHMKLFQKITERCFNDYIHSLFIYSSFCFNNYDLTYFISKSLFNCFGKNYVSTFGNIKNKRFSDGKIKKFKT